MRQALPSEPGSFVQKDFLSQTIPFEVFFERNPPLSLSGREHSLVLSCASTLRGAEAKKLIGRQGQNGKHEMGSDLSASSHANHCRAKLVLETRKDPFYSGAVPVAPFPVGVHRTLYLSAPGIGVDDGNASLAAHQILDRLLIVGGIGQGVEERRPLARSFQEIRSGLTVMNRGPCQHTGQRDLSIGRENMELEPFPGFHLPLAVFFIPSRTLGARLSGSVQAASGHTGTKPEDLSG